jgi:hypothetical protein
MEKIAIEHGRSRKEGQEGSKTAHAALGRPEEESLVLRASYQRERLRLARIGMRASVMRPFVLTGDREAVGPLTRLMRNRRCTHGQRRAT